MQHKPIWNVKDVIVLATMLRNLHAYSSALHFHDEETQGSRQIKNAVNADTGLFSVNKDVAAKKLQSLFN